MSLFNSEQYYVQLFKYTLFNKEKESIVCMCVDV